MTYHQSMNTKTLVEEINKILRTSWSPKQRAVGKWIQVLWDWAPTVEKVIDKYKECGWLIKRQVEIGPDGRKVWLVFVNPHWVNTGHEEGDFFPPSD